MKNLQTVLFKRNFKFLLCIAATLFCGLGVISFGTFLFREGFSWWILIVGLLLVFGFLLFASKIYTYLSSQQVYLMVESDGNTITFYNKTDSGKTFNTSEVIDLNKMGRFYIVKKRTRYFMNNYSYAFEEKGSRTSLFKTDVDAFPSLFEASENDRNKVLEFVKSVYPSIDLGYESAWQKSKKGIN
ncbi:MAG: hypothetical protein LDL23_02905 [Flavobacterium sp.]|uniref:hypothetical protein n=1 Tax=Flavobacterium sp. TaxID=239 RepID=UPI0025C0F3AF|nr:hypothetical protein [Flavobacterium sp.]MCA1965581.1 hypothetical protein [Flavobacterium sp.]